MDAGIEGLKFDKMRLSRKPPLSLETKVAVLTKTATEKPSGDAVAGRSPP